MNTKQKRKKKRKLIERDGCRCCLCGKDFPEEELTLEHLIPKSRGGTNHFLNLGLSCRQCNQSRGNSLHPLAKETK